jgi:hypothetical protein
MCGERMGMPHGFEFLTNRDLRITRDDADLEVAVLLALRDQHVARSGGLFCHDCYLNGMRPIATLAQFDGRKGEFFSAEFLRGGDAEGGESRPEVVDSRRHARCR